jgi:hypothetical protein
LFRPPLRPAERKPEGQWPKHIHQLSYRRNDDLDDAISATSKLDLNA